MKALVLFCLLATPMAAQAATDARFIANDASSEWRRYLRSPFADSIGALLIGTVVVHSRPTPPLSNEHLRGSTTVAGVTFFEPPSDELFLHEIGHVIDLQLTAHLVTDSLRSLFAANRNRFLYAGRGDAEYVAETFRIALIVMRAHRPATDADTAIAGSGLWFPWINQHWSH